MGSFQTFEGNFCQPKKNKSMALRSIKKKSKEVYDSDSNMSIKEMILFVKKFKTNLQ